MLRTLISKAYNEKIANYLAQQYVGNDYPRFIFLIHNSFNNRNIYVIVFDTLICHADCTTANRFLIFVSRWNWPWWSMRHWMLAETCRRTLYIIEIASVVFHLLIYTRSLITNTAWQPHGSPDRTFIQPVSLVDIIDELVSLRRGRSWGMSTLDVNKLKTSHSYILKTYHKLHLTGFQISTLLVRFNDKYVVYNDEFLTC